MLHCRHVYTSAKISECQRSRVSSVKNQLYDHSREEVSRARSGCFRTTPFLLGVSRTRICHIPSNNALSCSAHGIRHSAHHFSCAACSLGAAACCSAYEPTPVSRPFPRDGLRCIVSCLRAHNDNPCRADAQGPLLSFSPRFARHMLSMIVIAYGVSVSV